MNTSNLIVSSILGGMLLHCDCLLRRTSRWICLSILLGLLVGRSGATTVLPLSVNEVVRQAEDIVLGSVETGKSRWGDGTHRWMVTDYTLTVQDVLYGTNTTVGQKAVLTYWGGPSTGKPRLSLTCADPRLANAC